MLLGVGFEGRTSLAPQGDRGRFRHGQFDLETLARRDIADLAVTGLPTDLAGDGNFGCATPTDHAVDGERQTQLENAVMHPERLARARQSVRRAGRSNQRALNEALVFIEDHIDGHRTLRRRFSIDVSASRNAEADDKILLDRGREGVPI
jgi:hypothetical protein